MEKILVIVDPLQPSVKAIDFACYIANLTHSKLTGLFLENTLQTSEKKVHETTDNTSFAQFDKTRSFEESMYSFEEVCTKRNVVHNIHRDRGIPVTEVIEESRFADLIITDAQVSFLKKHEGSPTTFVKALLHSAECPVVIAPENIEEIDEIIFTYDGTRSSVFALKQFTYLLPQLHNRSAILLRVTKENETATKEKYKLKEWLKAHYININLTTLHGNPVYELPEYMLHKKNSFLVMGAYGRNFFSNVFNPSHADLILKTIDAPVFIAHY